MGEGCPIFVPRFGRGPQEKAHADDIFHQPPGEMSCVGGIFHKPPSEMSCIQGKLADHVEDYVVRSPKGAVLVTSPGTEPSNSLPALVERFVPSSKRLIDRSIPGFLREIKR